MEAEGQPTEYPESHIIQFPASHAGGFENTVQKHGRRHGSTLFRKNALTASLLVIKQTSFRASIIQNDLNGAQSMEKIIC